MMSPEAAIGCAWQRAGGSPEGLPRPPLRWLQSGGSGGCPPPPHCTALHCTSLPTSLPCPEVNGDTADDDDARRDTAGRRTARGGGPQAHTQATRTPCDGAKGGICRGRTSGTTPHTSGRAVPRGRPRRHRRASRDPAMRRRGCGAFVGADVASQGRPCGPERILVACARGHPRQRPPQPPRGGDSGRTAGGVAHARRRSAGWSVR